MMIKYKCLILDHDDTSVESTPQIHYPSFKEALSKLRPNLEFTLDDFFKLSFDPGFSELCHDILKFTDEEMTYQYEIWRKNTEKATPDFFEGFLDLLSEFKKAGGIIAVVSHSSQDRIEDNYKVKANLFPDIIFGWDDDKSKRKPSPYPVKELMKNFSLKPEELLVVDDLKPGLVMAKSCNVEFAAAGWGHDIKEIKEYMGEHSDFYLSCIDDLKKLVFDN